MQLRVSRVLTLLVCILLTAACPLAAQKSDSSSSSLADTLHQDYIDNLDRLLNLWYVRDALDSAASPVPDMDSFPLPPECHDSVYIARLQRLHSIVELSFNSTVRNYINVYTRRRRGQVCIMLGLADYYFPLFEAVLNRYQLPLELRILPIVESALNPRAVSRMGATGLWQFMYSTGRRYGLTINSYVDERRDPMLATEAAARYLRDLYAIYGDWTLVIAAYNCGPGNVNKAIRRADGKTNYWDIYYFLPRETRGYVPAFIGATYAMAYHDLHNIPKCSTKIPMYSDTLYTHGRLHLEQVAHVLNLPIALLRDINPQYKHDLLPSETANMLRLPIGKIGEFIEREDEIRAYKDSLYLIAPLVREPLVVRGIDVGVPGKGQAIKYKVRQGDVLGAIARRYGVSVRQLREWNGISGNMIRTGQTLLIYKK